MSNVMYRIQKVELPMPRACIMYNGGIPDRVIADTIDILLLPHSSIPRSNFHILYFVLSYFVSLYFEFHIFVFLINILSDCGHNWYPDAASQLYPAIQSNFCISYFVFCILYFHILYLYILNLIFLYFWLKFWVITDTIGILPLHQSSIQ